MSIYKNDKSEYLEQAIKSILNQTVTPNEIVIVKDGPISMELEQVITKLMKEYEFFKIISLKENQGLGDALNKGLEQCTYDIVARMDADDISVNNRFELQIKEFEDDPDLDLLGAYISEFISEPNMSISVREVPLEYDQICKYIKTRNPFNHVTVMFKKSAIQECRRLSKILLL